MRPSTILVKFHEPALKGRNRPVFINKILHNLKLATKDLPIKNIWHKRLIIGLSINPEAEISEIAERITNCFGIAKFYPAYEVEKNLDSIFNLLNEILPNIKFDTFRITAKRPSKNFNLTSDEINRKVGTFVQEFSKSKVQLKNPDLEIFIEIMEDKIFVHTEEFKGFGGMPVGVSGKAMALMSGGIDSPVAIWQMLKRGTSVDMLHFHSYPLVDKSSIEKAYDLAKVLNHHQYKSTLFLAPLSKIQQKIIVEVPPAYRVVLYRRFMIRIAEKLAISKKSIALITGESLAQVASQTLENIAAIDDASSIPILRPLIGTNKDEIIDHARKIGTFDISIRPDQDCCSLFVPKHPITAARTEILESFENSLPMDQMIENSIEETTEKTFTYP